MSPAAFEFWQGLIRAVGLGLFAYIVGRFLFLHFVIRRLIRKVGERGRFRVWIVWESGKREAAGFAIGESNALELGRRTIARRWMERGEQEIADVRLELITPPEIKL